MVIGFEILRKWGFIYGVILLMGRKPHSLRAARPGRARARRRWGGPVSPDPMRAGRGWRETMKKEARIYAAMIRKLEKRAKRLMRMGNPNTDAALAALEDAKNTDSNEFCELLIREAQELLQYA